MKWNVIYCYSNCDYDGHFEQVARAVCKRLFGNGGCMKMKLYK